MIGGETFLVLGGGGMIGRQIVHEIACELRPLWIIICSRHQKEVREALDRFRREFPYVRFIGFWGDVFLRAEWNVDDRQHHLSRSQMLDSPEHRDALYDDLFGDFDAAYTRSQLVQLILEHRPSVVVDSINTATAIGYQDIYAATDYARSRFEMLVAEPRGLRSHDPAGAEGAWNGEPRDESGPGLDQLPELIDSAGSALEKLAISQSVPQLIRHVLLIHRAMTEAGTQLYLKVGTTGTGGMGLNVPYTHSEDKPSATLMTKTAIAFAHTGLMFLMARTVDGPVVKEIKPGAMVGYANITCRTITRQGKPMYRFAARVEELGEALTLRRPEREYERLEKLQLPVVDTGENGVFTRGEFEAITHMWQMEFITPEEIARQTVLEIKGSNTGYDMIAAVDSAVMNPSYRAGYLRQFALDEVARLERTTGSHSVALGQLGPPEIGKLLWEAQLLKLRYGLLSAVIEEPAESIASEVYTLVQSDPRVRDTIVSVGLPILAPDGCSLIRGPFIRIPESPHVNSVPLTLEAVDRWAARGWIDLRPKNFQCWRRRFMRMQREAQRLRGRGSAAVTREAYLSDEILAGTVVGWIFNNEDRGYRVK